MVGFGVGTRAVSQTAWLGVGLVLWFESGGIWGGCNTVTYDVATKAMFPFVPSEAPT